MKAAVAALLCLAAVAATATTPSRIKVDADGGYTGIVVKIDKNVPEDECARILENLKVRSGAWGQRTYSTRYPSPPLSLGRGSHAPMIPHNETCALPRC